MNRSIVSVYVLSNTPTVCVFQYKIVHSLLYLQHLTPTQTRLIPKNPLRVLRKPLFVPCKQGPNTCGCPLTCLLSIMVSVWLYPLRSIKDKIQPAHNQNTPWISSIVSQPQTCYPRPVCVLLRSHALACGMSVSDRRMFQCDLENEGFDYTMPNQKPLPSNSRTAGRSTLGLKSETKSLGLIVKNRFKKWLPWPGHGNRAKTF